MEKECVATTMIEDMRVCAKTNHPTHQKLERLVKFLQDELKVELSFYHDRIFIKNMEIPHERDWEVVDPNGEFISELPTNKYKLMRDIEYDIPKAPKPVHTICGMVPKDMSYEPTEK